MLQAVESRLKAFAKELGVEEVDPSIYDKIKELVLDGHAIKSISAKDAAELEKFKNLTKLTLNGTGLTSLVNFPVMPNLKVLELTDNNISDPVVFSLIPKLFPNIKVLQLGGNHLKNTQDVQFLAQLPNLISLGLAMNPMESTKNYRETIFNLLPKLELLDQADSSGVEKTLNSDEEEYDEEEEQDEEGSGDDDESADLLKKFYETEYKSEDEEDDEEFVPGDEGDEDEDIEDEDEDAEEEEFQGDGATSSGKRPREEANQQSAPEQEA
ncbi:bifunctional Leucine-rich repeat domain superfamily/Acidic leucine-rich nuclear phosphoprotein 32 [Babesia duncani]|uniref:Bifunctional Leucine-rich repeat domain superfamily/Acidic leucine-rich nuclear phosphoprotein 32 n=1 Tax=Babesia duncani TaxID=323732 RepID=A0AAD9PMB7_9APIC|nr:bifunctional Leucine-rich repeat domain superfamily/Acidic leucine-rich nuclear phosphoprotein 32 [Babesia duncani]